MFVPSKKFGRYGDYGYTGKLGQADWFYGGKPAAEFVPCKPGQIQQEWGGGIRCIDPAMVPKAPAPTPPLPPLPETLPPGTLPEPTAPPIISEEYLDIEEGYDLEDMLPYIIGGGIVFIMVWVLILKLL